MLTIGVLAGALVQFGLWGYHSFYGHLPPIDATTSAALTTLLTALFQYVDRISKRHANHVIRKHGGA